MEMMKYVKHNTGDILELTTYMAKHETKLGDDEYFALMLITTTYPGGSFGDGMYGEYAIGVKKKGEKYRISKKALAVKDTRLGCLITVRVKNVDKCVVIG